MYLLLSFGGSTWRFIDTAGLKKRANQDSGTDYYASLRTATALERCEVAVVVLDVDDVSVSVVVAAVSKDEVNLHDAFAVVAAHTL